MTATTELRQFAPEAASLFNNMKTPASILVGALVPLALGSPLPIKNPDDDRLNSPMDVRLRKSYNVVAVLSLLSELLVIVWATVAVNQLTETNVPKVASVWDLLQKEYSLPWSAANAHFMFGAFGFAYAIGCRVYFHVDKGLLGKGLACFTTSALLLMTSVVNRGIASGGGDGIHRYGKSVIALFCTYGSLLLTRAKACGALGVLEIASLILTTAGLALCLQSIFFEKEKE